MRVFYAEANYGNDEIDAVLKVLQEDRLAIMDGKQVHELEAEVAGLFRKKFGLMTNSGSSANLLGIKGLRLPKDSKVITPALTFSTTVAPLVQSDLVPLFVDVEIGTLQINTAILDSIPLDNVSAICVPNLIGNVANWEEIYGFARVNNLKIIEDSADTIGYIYETDLNDWSDVSTTSFYASHVVTGSGFGGMTAFKNEEDYIYAKSLRGWGRRSSQYGETEDYKRRFECKISGYDYDDKYVFDDLGYNFMPSEISAAFALVQLRNLKNNLQSRADNFKTLSHSFSKSENFSMFHTYDNVFTGWLAFPMLLTNKLKGKRKEFQIYLEKAGIQTRTIFTGNILKQPVAEKFIWDSHGSFEISDEIMQNGIMLGCHNQMTEEKMAYMQEIVFKAEAAIA